MFDMPDRELSPPEHEGEMCELCGDDIPVDSRSWCYCDTCFFQRVAEKTRQEMNLCLLGIARSIDKLDDTIKTLEELVQEQAE